eukprot:3014339-Amphidinium_carterae.2
MKGFQALVLWLPRGCPLPGLPIRGLSVSLRSGVLPLIVAPPGRASVLPRAAALSAPVLGAVPAAKLLGRFRLPRAFAALGGSCLGPRSSLLGRCLGRSTRAPLGLGNLRRLVSGRKGLLVPACPLCRHHLRALLWHWRWGHCLRGCRSNFCSSGCVLLKGAGSVGTAIPWLA